MLLRFSLAFLALFLATSALALSPQAERGKQLYANSCDNCHNQALDPPLAPPMWGVKRKYLRNTMDEADFIQRIVQFVKKPSRETALHDKAVRRMGLMPAMPLPDDMLLPIANYILEHNFRPPCDHWRIGAERARQAGDQAHLQKDLRKLQRFCN